MQEGDSMIIKANYWPNTPHLREIKIYINEKLEISSFCDRHQIEKMLITLLEARQELIMDEMRVQQSEEIEDSKVLEDE